MKKIISIFFLLIIMNVSAQINVERIISEGELFTGQTIEPKLKIQNDFSGDIKITLKDKFTVNGSGVNIECFEAVLPANKSSEIAYPAITLTKPGDFNLETASISYTNPDTGKEETIATKHQTISVTGDEINGINKTENIYQCNGVNSHSTQISTGNISSSISSNFPGQESSNQSTQDKINNIGQNTNQNTQAIKNQIESQNQKNTQTNKALENNPEYNKIKKELEENGFNQTSQSTRENNSFNQTFENPKGEKSEINGKINPDTNKAENIFQTGTIPNLEEQIMKNNSELNKKFIEKNNELNKKGFSSDPMQFEVDSEKKGKFSKTYTNKNTLEEIKIEGEIDQDKITKIEPLKENNGGQSTIFPYALIALLLSFISAFFVYKKYFSNQKTEESKINEKSIVSQTGIYLKELEAANKLFKKSQQKEAYLMAGKAIRSYVKEKQNITSEITQNQAINYLKSKKCLNSVKKTFNLVSMVGFAKYTPNKKDFEYIIKTANEIFRQ